MKFSSNFISLLYQGQLNIGSCRFLVNTLEI